MKVKIISISLLFCLLFTSTPVSGSTDKNENIQKNETVYVILNHDGSVKDERVVNWVHGIPGKGAWTDYGRYSKVTNIVSDVKPFIDRDKLFWPPEAFKGHDLFYQGFTSKKLPFNVAIDYLLDGDSMGGGELAGQSGELEIHITIKNNLLQDKAISYKDYYGKVKEKNDVYYTPLAAQVSLEVNLDKFSDIEAQDAGKVVVGNKMKLSWVVFPYPEQEIVLKMEGNDIELDPISIGVLPQNPPIPEIDMEKDLTDLIKGLESLEGGAASLEEGANKLSEGQNALKSNSQKLVDGIGQLNDGLSQINSKSYQIDYGIGGLKSGADQLKSGADALADGLEQLQEAHKKQAELADILSMLPSPCAQLLAESLLEEQRALSQLVYGARSLESGADKLSSGAGELKAGFGVYAQGIKDAGAGASELYNKVKALPAGVDQITQGQSQLNSGIKALRQDGIVKMKDQIIQSTDEIYFGKAKKDTIKELADNYRSFMDNDNNKNSRVQFILQTEEIKKEAVKEENKNQQPAKTGFFQRLISLFKKTK